MSDFVFESFQVTMFIEYSAWQIIPLYHRSRKEREALGSSTTFERNVSLQFEGYDFQVA